MGPIYPNIKMTDALINQTKSNKGYILNLQD